MSHHITTDISEETPPSCPALFAFVRHLRPISPVTYSQGYDDDDLRYILPCKKLYVVLSVPFSCFWRKKKKEEAKPSLYPILPLSYSVLPCSVLSWLLLPYCIAYFLSFSFSFVYRSEGREISIYIPDIAKHSKDPTIIPLFILPNRP